MRGEAPDAFASTVEEEFAPRSLAFQRNLDDRAGIIAVRLSGSSANASGASLGKTIAAVVAGATGGLAGLSFPGSEVGGSNENSSLSRRHRNRLGS